MNRLNQPAESEAVRAGAHAAHRTGIFLLLTAAATIVMVYSRVAADTDQPTLLESLRAIEANMAMYSLTGAARLVSGITLVAAAVFLWKAGSVQEGFGTSLVSLLFATSGVYTAVSGACALALAAAAPGAAGPGGRWLLNGDSGLSALVHREGWVCRRGVGACCNCPADVEGRGRHNAYGAGVSHYRRSNAANMGRRRNYNAPNLRSRLLCVACRHRRSAG